MNRMKVLLALALMPDEAFGWFIVWAGMGSPQGSMKQQRQVAQMFPDGLGGFSKESQEAIEILRKEAAAFIKAESKPKET